MTRALLGCAALLALALPAAGGSESLVLQPSAPATGPGGTVEIQVLVRVHPDGKAVVPVRVSDVTLRTRGGGTVAPSTESTGETRWTYRAPGSVGSDLDVTVEAALTFYPDATGSCRIAVKAPAKPAPVTPAGAPAPPAAAPAADDEEGDLVEGAEAVAADPVGKLVTLEKWTARNGPGDAWNERKIPARGEPLYAPGEFQEFRFRVNSANARSVSVQWWRGDNLKRVRTFTAANRQIDLDRDQDGFSHARFAKRLGKEHGEYTFAVVVTTADGKTLRENLVVHRARPPKEEEEGKDGKGKGKEKR